MKGGAPRAIWCTSETDPRVSTARSVAADLIRADRPPHLVWCPSSGDLVQLLAVTGAAHLLPDPVGCEGRVCVQIMVVGRTDHPFTQGPLLGLSPIMRWLDDWRVPRRWPAGPPSAPPQAYDTPRNRRPWARGGHFGRSQVPGTAGTEPGAIDIDAITGAPFEAAIGGMGTVDGTRSPLAEIPRQRREPDPLGTVAPVSEGWAKTRPPAGDTEPALTSG